MSDIASSDQAVCLCQTGHNNEIPLRWAFRCSCIWLWVAVHVIPCECLTQHELYVRVWVPARTHLSMNLDSFPLCWSRKPFPKIKGVSCTKIHQRLLATVAWQHFRWLFPLSVVALEADVFVVPQTSHLHAIQNNGRHYYCSYFWLSPRLRSARLVVADFALPQRVQQISPQATQATMRTTPPR